MEIIAPPLVVASTEPYSAMLIRMKAETLPFPADSFAYAALSPNSRKKIEGVTRAKITVRRLRSRRRISSFSTVKLNPPIGGTGRLVSSAAVAVVVTGSLQWCRRRR